MNGSILELRKSPDALVRQRSTILSEAQLYEWLVSLSKKREPVEPNFLNKSGITTQLHVSQLLDGTNDQSVTLTVGVRTWLDMDWPQFFSMCGQATDGADTDTTLYRDVRLHIDDWPFLVIECVGLAMYGQKLYGSNIPDAVQKQYATLFPHTSLEQLALWFDNDLVTIDPTGTDIAQLYEVLVNQEMRGPATADFPDIMMD